MANTVVDAVGDADHTGGVGTFVFECQNPGRCFRGSHPAPVSFIEVALRPRSTVAFAAVAAATAGDFGLARGSCNWASRRGT